jgi:peptidoglycan/xylan/chitin deacetylase (PgdA/CDA1 family)
LTLLHHRQFSGWARGHLLCRVEGVPGRFALTFDDGPSAAWTPRILDTVNRHGARATFFMLARNILRHPDLVRRLVAQGHEAALHGDGHWPLPLLPRWGIRGEIERCAAALEAVAGVRARLYRPPFGFMMPSQASFVRALGYQSVLGDVYPEDPGRPGVERIVARVVPRLGSGSILILHDGSPLGVPDRGQTAQALEIILGHAADQGLRAVTVSALLDARPESGIPARPES